MKVAVVEMEMGMVVVAVAPVTVVTTASNDASSTSKPLQHYISVRD